YIDSQFKHINIKEFSGINIKTNERYSDNPIDNRNYFYFGFKKEINTVRFSVLNKESITQNLVLEFSNSLIAEIQVFQEFSDSIKLIHKTGIDFPFSTRPISHQHFSFPIKLKAFQSATFLLKLKKEVGRPLVTSVTLKNKSSFAKQSFMQQLMIGLYYGISLLSILFSLFIFFFLRKSSYLIYAGYVVFLGLFLSSYLGLFPYLFLSPDAIFNKYTHYVLFSEIALLLFVIFSQKILDAKKYMPRLRKIIISLIIVLVLVRLLLHFVFTNLFSGYVPIFMKLWYVVFIIALILITIEIILFYKKNNVRTSFFAIAYLFMLLGTFLTILYHSYGLINTIFLGLPVLFYASFMEILFLTFTIIFMVKEIYDERNILSKELVIEQRRFLSSFMKGEEKERNRIGQELHDNIGSKLGHLKRFVHNKIENKEVDSVIDELCNDVRNLSHKISLGEMKLVGFVNSAADLINIYKNETGLEINFNAFHPPTEINENISTNLFRVLQEALNNIIKHAKANEVTIQIIGYQKEITLSIEDDGKGFDSIAIKEGIGIKNMSARIKSLKGKFSIDSQPNVGTSILITVPIN
ncbi:MAG: hypothetical protein KJN66_10460, partial [Bacteroidia bacterium]|nr:hypothetical protein [Bacteroidia bacterium]